MSLNRSDLLEGFGDSKKTYAKAAPIAGVEVYPLQRLVDDRGLFLEVFRGRATHAGSEGLASFSTGFTVAQLNYSLVTTSDHIKGLHFHLEQEDVWFCPPPFKLKAVLLDLRRDSPTAGLTQTVVLGDGRDALLRIPAGVAHGYRPITVPCGLFYIVTNCFDIADPDEHRVPWDHPTIKDLWPTKNE